ncbi:MAG: hypothetical protein KAJ51_12220, partial [Thermoplasmata archaeon]|nr:hypothetical protein [Thermoplasmata archaeon]
MKVSNKGISKFKLQNVNLKFTISDLQFPITIIIPSSHNNKEVIIMLANYGYKDGSGEYFIT